MSAPGPITIGEQSFAARRETYDVLLAREELAEREAQAVDDANGIAVEIEHAQSQLLALGRADGDFDGPARDALKARLKELRARSREAGNALLRVQVELLTVRLDPTPEVAFLLSHLTPDELTEVTERLNGARPTWSSSAGESVGS